MQRPLPQSQPQESSDVNLRYAEFAAFKGTIRQISEILLDQNWRDIDEVFINDAGSELRLTIKELEKISTSPKIEDVINKYIFDILRTLTNAVVNLYEYLDLKDATNSQSRTNSYSKIIDCREQLSLAEALIQDILDEMAPEIAADPPVANNQLSSVEREQIPEQPFRQSTSRRTRKKAGTEDQPPERQSPPADTEIELPIEREGSSPSDANSSSLALLEEQGHNNVSSSSLQEVPDQTGSNDVPLTRSDVESLLSAVEGPSHLKLNARDLRGIDLRDFNLAGVDLANADLTEAILRSANLQGANMQGANMTYANLRDADLQGAKLQRAKLQGVDLSRVDLSEVDLSEADLSLTSLRGAILRKADLFGTVLWKADLQEADLREAILVDASLQGADLLGADLSDADLQGADLRYIKLFDTKFEGAALKGAKIFQEDLNFAYLTRKQKAGLNLQEAEPDIRDLGGSDPNEALLQKPDTVSALVDHRDQLEIENVPETTLWWRIQRITKTKLYLNRLF